MIHSLSGGIISEYDTLIYVFTEIRDGAEKGVKRWYICPFLKIEKGNLVEVPALGGSATAEVLRVERVTKQTAPYPVNRTKEIEKIIR